MRYHALIPAGGSGSRFRSDSPKQYWMLAGKPVLAHSLDRLAVAFSLDQIHVAIAPGDRWYDEAIGRRAGVTVLRCGGATRAETVRNALSAMAAADSDWVLVHDAVRPCIDAESLSRLRKELADDAVGGLLALPVVGTLKRGDAEGRSVATEPREGLWTAQTPQMFRFGVLRGALAHPGAGNYTDEAQAVEALGIKPKLVTGNPGNLKITYPGDLALAEAIMAAQQRAIGAAIAPPPPVRNRVA